MYSSTLTSTLALDGGGWSMPHPGRFTPGKDPGTHCIGGWVGPQGPVWTDAENLALNRDSIPQDRLVRNESLYRLSYLGS